MNPDQPSREEIEVKLTALLLGELPANEAKLLRWTIAHDAQLKQLHDRLKLTIGLVREVSAKTSAKATDHETGKTDDLKLSESRRGKLLAQLEKPSPQPLFWLKRIEMPRLPALLLPALAALAILGLLAAFVLPNFVKARSTSPANAIINNLRALDAAKQEWALEQHKPADAAPTMEDLKPYLTKNGVQPVADEKYVLGEISESPVANLAGSLNKKLPSGGRSRQLRLDSNGAGDGNVAMASAASASPSVVTVAPSPLLAPPPTRIVLPSAEPAHEATVVTGSLNDQGNTWNVSGNLQGFYDDAHGPVAHGGVISYGLPSSLPPKSLPGSLPSSFSSGVAMAPNPIAEMQPNAFADSDEKNTSLDKSAVPSAGGGGNILGVEFRQIVTNNTDLALNWPARDRAAAEKQPAQTTERFSTDSFFANKKDATKTPADSLATDDFMPDIPPPTQATAAATPVNGVDLSAPAPVASRAYRPGTSSIGPSTGGDATDKELVERLLATSPAASPAPNVSDAATRRPPADAPVPQPEILTRDNPFSTFSLNVSDVSFKLAAASLEKGQLPDPASIRSEEFINAFDYRDPEAAPGEPIAFATERARYPFAQNRDLLRFSLKTAAAGRPAGRALNLVLLLDNSGSMERADRVQIIRAALAVLTTQLQPQDTVSVVTFARTARLWLDGASGTNAGAALEKIGELTPQGGTNLEEAMRLAYETARRHYQAGGLNRVVMLTDGAANLGSVDAAALTEKVEANRRQGIALDCFGIGWEGLNDDLLEQLTRHGDGRYAFINTPEEATQQFAAKLAGALQIAAADVKVQVEFNPQRVVSYRQIGYAKHQLTKEQFRDNAVDAAEIAAQEAGNALYTVETKPAGSGPVATVRVRYKIPGTTDYRERSWDVPYTGNAVALAQASPALRLAATASAFSEWLAVSPFAQEISPAQLTPFMAGVPEIYGADERPKQLVLMLLQAKSLAGK